jgi:hypothetical protein
LPEKPAEKNGYNEPTINKAYMNAIKKYLIFRRKKL